jgi:RsmE family RNA methyltransferase
VRPRLIEGLEQAGDTRLPEVTVERRLKPFIEDELDEKFPDTHRLLAHPEAGESITASPGRQPTLLAVGPEGGWTPFELELFEAHGFSRLGLGPRRLRTDVACIALITACGVHR